MFDVFAFHRALRGLCGLGHARIGPDRQNLCQTDMFVPGTDFFQIRNASGALVVPTFQEVSAIFFTTMSWGSNPGRWHGKPSQKCNHSDRSAVRCYDEVDLRTLKLPHYKVTRDDKRGKFTLQTDLSKCGRDCEPYNRLLALAMRAKVKATTIIDIVAI